MLFEGVGNGEGALVIADDDGDNLALGVEGVESGLLEACAKALGVVKELGAEVGGLLEEVEGGEGGGELGGGWGGGVDEGAGGLDKVIAEEGGAGYVAAIAAVGFAEGSHGKGGLIGEVELVDASGTVGAEDAGGVGFVDHEHGVVFGGELADVGEGGEIAVHAVEGFDEDEAFVAVGGVLLKAVVEVGGVVVFKADEFGTGEFGAVDHAGVDEAVGEDEVVAVDEVGDGAETGEIAGAV